MITAFRRGTGWNLKLAVAVNRLCLKLIESVEYTGGRRLLVMSENSQN